MHGGKEDSMKNWFGEDGEFSVDVLPFRHCWRGVAQLLNTRSQVEGRGSVWGEA
jgi:hypothetical protein